MSAIGSSGIPTPELAHKLILEQFQEFAHLPIDEVEKQGHDNKQFIGTK